VSNRIAAEVEIEILRPFEPELIIARQQKEDLDKKISAANKGAGTTSNQQPTSSYQQPFAAPAKQTKQEFVPQDVSEKSNVTAIKNFYNAGNSSDANQNSAANTPPHAPTNFDWDNFGKTTPNPSLNKGGEQVLSSSSIQQPETSNQQLATGLSVDEKIDKLTDTINRLVSDRFGGEKKDDGLSEQMKELMKRLEMAEKENQENKKLIQKLQSNNQFESLQKNIFDLPKDANKINVDKPRNVNIDKTKTLFSATGDISGNVKVVATTQNPIPIQKTPEPKVSDLDLMSKKSLDLQGDFAKNLTSSEAAKPETKIYSSVVSQTTADTIVETRNKENTSSPVTSSTKSVLSLDELLKKNDNKISGASKHTAQVIFPTINNEKKVDIKNVAQTETLRQALLDDLAFINSKNGKANTQTSSDQMTSIQQNIATKNSTSNTNNNSTTNTQTTNANTTDNINNLGDLQNLQSTQTGSITLNQFKDELIPKTKEDRMKALQDKIKAMNKGVSSGGANSIAASALDPYKL
jgi:ATP-dependent Lon protease